MDDYIDCPYCASASPAEEVRAEGGHCPVCGKANYELDGYMGGYRQGGANRNPPSHRTAGEGMSYEDTMKYIDQTLAEGEQEPQQAAGRSSLPGWQHVDDGEGGTWFHSHPSGLNGIVEDQGMPGTRAWWEVYDNPHDPPVAAGGHDDSDGDHMDAEDAMREAQQWIEQNHHLRNNPHHEAGRAMGNSMRTAAIDFVAGQNTADREELLFRAHRHASDRTGQLPVPVAQRAVQEFVAAVNREIASTPKPRRQAAQRTAATVPDFPDELMF